MDLIIIIRIISPAGIKQGVPLSSLLFARIVDSAARAAGTDINVWYLDDGALAGPLSNVISSIQRVKAEMENRLELKHKQM